MVDKPFIRQHGFKINYAPLKRGQNQSHFKNEKNFKIKPVWF